MAGLYIIIGVLCLIGSLVLTLEEFVSEEPRFPLGAKHCAGARGFRKLQRSGRDWDLGDRLDGFWDEYSFYRFVW